MFSAPLIANIASATNDGRFRLERVNGRHLVTDLADKALRLTQLPFSHSLLTHHTLRRNVSLVAVDKTLDPRQQLATAQLPLRKQINHTSMKSFNDSISVPVIMYKRGDSHWSNYSSLVSSQLPRCTACKPSRSHKCRRASDGRFAASAEDPRSRKAEGSLRRCKSAAGWQCYRDTVYTHTLPGTA